MSVPYAYHVSVPLVQLNVGQGRARVGDCRRVRHHRARGPLLTVGLVKGGRLDLVRLISNVVPSAFGPDFAEWFSG